MKEEKTNEPNLGKNSEGVNKGKFSEASSKAVFHSHRSQARGEARGGGCGPHVSSLVTFMSSFSVDSIVVLDTKLQRNVW